MLFSQEVSPRLQNSVYILSCGWLDIKLSHYCVMLDEYFRQALWNLNVLKLNKYVSLIQVYVFSDSLLSEPKKLCWLIMHAWAWVAHYNSVLVAQLKCLRASAALSNDHNLSVGVWSVVRTMDSSTDWIQGCSEEAYIHFTCFHRSRGKHLPATTWTGEPKTTNVTCLHSLKQQPSRVRNGVLTFMLAS